MRRSSIPILWSFAGICAVVTLIGVFVWVSYQPSSAVEFACGLGDQASCSQITTINLTRFVAAFVAVICGFASLACTIAAAVEMGNAQKAPTQLPGYGQPRYPPYPQVPPQYPQYQYPPQYTSQYPPQYAPQHPTLPTQPQYPTFPSLPLPPPHPPTTQP